MNPFQMPDVNMFRKTVEQQKNLHFRHKNISMYVKSIFYLTIERYICFSPNVKCDKHLSTVFYRNLYHFETINTELAQPFSSLVIVVRKR